MVTPITSGRVFPLHPVRCNCRLPLELSVARDVLLSSPQQQWRSCRRDLFSFITLLSHRFPPLPLLPYSSERQEFITSSFTRYNVRRVGDEDQGISPLLLSIAMMCAWPSIYFIETAKMKKHMIWFFCALFNSHLKHRFTWGLTNSNIVLIIILAQATYKLFVWTKPIFKFFLEKD